MRNDGETALVRYGPTADGMRLGLYRHAELARDRIARDDGESALRRLVPSHVPSHGGRRQECEQERENKFVIHGMQTGVGYRTVRHSLPSLGADDNWPPRPSRCTGHSRRRRMLMMSAPATRNAACRYPLILVRKWLHD